jgi:hypothetical protein
MKTAILADTGTQLLPSCFLYVPTRGQPRADVASCMCPREVSPARMLLWTCGV